MNLRTLRARLARSPIVLAQSGEAITRTGSTVEGVMVAIPIPAGLLGVNGQIRVSAQYRRTTGAGQVGCRLRFGPTGLGGTSLFEITHATDGTLMLDTMIAAAGANDAQVCGLPLGAGYTTALAPVETAFDMTAEQFLTLTGRTEGNAADVLTLQRYQVLLFPG